MVLLHLETLMAATAVHAARLGVLLDERSMAGLPGLMVAAVVVAGGRADFVRAAQFQFTQRVRPEQALLAQCELSGPGTLELTHLPVQVHLNFLD